MGAILDAALVLLLPVLLLAGLAGAIYWGLNRETAEDPDLDD